MYAVVERYAQHRENRGRCHQGKDKPKHHGGGFTLHLPQAKWLFAGIARQLFPKEFDALDRTAGAAFPFTTELLQSAHAQWSADWLSWERMHDATYKVKAAEAEHELAASGGAPFVRAKLDAIEKEKLDLYQRRYQEYIRVAKALQALIPQLK